MDINIHKNWENGRGLVFDLRASNKATFPNLTLGKTRNFSNPRNGKPLPTFLIDFCHQVMKTVSELRARNMKIRRNSKTTILKPQKKSTLNVISFHRTKIFFP